MNALLTLLVYPLGTACALLLVGLVLLLLGRRRTSALATMAGLGWLYLWSMPLFSDAMIHRYESANAVLAASASPEAQAIVVLGGGLLHHSAWPHPDGNRAIDRYWHAARLFHAGKAPIIVVSGGYSKDRISRGTEADAARVFLIDLGVPADAIVLEDRSTTTRENAVFVAELAQEKGLADLLLVTSAMHMPRALGAFQAAGLNPAISATDPYWGQATQSGVGNLLPSAYSLDGSTRLVHEIIGHWYYRFRGWA